MKERLASAAGALRTALSEPRLRSVQLAWSGTITAEWAIIVALGVWAFDAAGAIGVGVMTLARTIPAAALGPVLASIVDRRRRDRVLGVVTLLRALFVAGMAVTLIGDGPTMVVYALAALDAISYSLYWPAQSSLLVELAHRPEELVAANVTTTTIENLGGLAGPAVAALMLAVSSSGVTMGLAALLLAVSLIALRPRRSHVAAAEPVVPEPDEGSLFAGFGLLVRAPGPRLVASLYLGYTLALGALTVLVVMLAIESLGMGESGVGVLTASMGVGGLVGSIAALGLVGTPRLGRALTAGVAGWAVATALLGLAPPVALALGLLAAGGIASALVDVAGLTLLQRLVPEQLLGRVLGVVEGLWWATWGVGGFAASLLSARFGVELAVGAVGITIVALAIVADRAMTHIDATAAVPRDRVRALLRDHILGPLPTPELERLALIAEPASAEQGEVIVRIGDVGDSYYLVVRGSVEVVRPGVRARLGPGDGFGELALINDAPRNATVTALEATELLTIDRAHFVETLRGNPHSAAAADELAARRLNAADDG